MGSRIARAAMPVIGVVLALLWQWPGLYNGLNIYDEGIILFGAARIMNGELPYRDFWTQYSPGQYYFLAALFSVTGQSVLAARWWDMLTRALLALACAALAAQAGGRRAAAPIWAFTVIWLTFYGFFSYPIFQGLLFSFVCIALFLHARRDPRWNLAAGLSFGAAFAFRHDMAAYLAVALVITRAVDGVFAREPFMIWLRSWVRFVVGAAVIVAPVALFFLLQVNVHELATQLLIFPLTEFPKVRDLPYPEFTGAPDSLPFYVPFAIYGLSLIIAVRELARPIDAASRAGALAMLAVVMFGVFGFNQARVRSDLIHTVHFFLTSLLLLPALASGMARLGNVARWLTTTVLVTLVAALLVEPLDSWQTVRRDNEVRAKLAGRVRNGPPSAWGLPIEDWQLNVYLASRFYLEPGQPIYFGLKNHDKVFANDVMSYFLAGRRALTRYHEMHPGLIETAPVQREIVAELERTRPPVLFLTAMFEGAQEKNDANKDSGVEILDEYIRKHYLPYGSSGPYEIFRRRKGM
jgi:hypothetical protein